MSSQSIIDFDISIKGDRYSRPSAAYKIEFDINYLKINGVPVVQVENVGIYLEKGLHYNILINQPLPCQVLKWLTLPNKIGGWCPAIMFNGIDQYGYRQQIPLIYSRPIISTTYYPIYDARLGRSNWTTDEYKIVQIKKILNMYGFDCSTIGKEIQPVIPKGKDFMDFEKDWASGGDCFISVLTPRDRTANGRLALPPPWVVTESGLSYESDRPQLAFIEKGVNRVGLYEEIDNTHVIGFQTDSGKVSFETEIIKKIGQFRKECQTHQTKKQLEGERSLLFSDLLSTVDTNF